MSNRLAAPKMRCHSLAHNVLKPNGALSPLKVKSISLEAGFIAATTTKLKMATTKAITIAVAQLFSSGLNWSPPRESS